MMRDRIYKWVARHHPEGPRWTDPAFTGYRQFPAEVRFLLSSDKLEFEIGNGGLAQFLWNTFYHWRWILEDCEAGYRMMGAAQQAGSIPEFRRLCEEHEAMCREYILACVRTKDFGKFNEWMLRAEPTLRSEKEALFYSGSGLEEAKVRWFGWKHARIKRALAEWRRPAPRTVLDPTPPR